MLVFYFNKLVPDSEIKIFGHYKYMELEVDGQT